MPKNHVYTLVIFGRGLEVRQTLGRSESLGLFSVPRSSNIRLQRFWEVDLGSMSNVQGQNYLCLLLLLLRLLLTPAAAPLLHLTPTPGPGPTPSLPGLPYSLKLLQLLLLRLLRLVLRLLLLQLLPARKRCRSDPGSRPCCPPGLSLRQSPTQICPASAESHRDALSPRQIKVCHTVTRPGYDMHNTSQEAKIHKLMDFLIKHRVSRSSTKIMADFRRNMRGLTPFQVS